MASSASGSSSNIRNLPLYPISGINFDSTRIGLLQPCPRAPRGEVVLVVVNPQLAVPHKLVLRISRFPIRSDLWIPRVEARRRMTIRNKTSPCLSHPLSRKSRYPLHLLKAPNRYWIGLAALYHFQSRVDPNMPVLFLGQTMKCPVHQERLGTIGHRLSMVQIKDCSLVTITHGAAGYAHCLGQLSRISLVLGPLRL
jgi:hypothetical protein